MNCNDLLLWFESDDPAQVQEAKVHLSHCPACREILEDWEQWKGAKAQIPQEHRELWFAPLAVRPNRIGTPGLLALTASLLVLLGAWSLFVFWSPRAPEQEQQITEILETPPQEQELAQSLEVPSSLVIEKLDEMSARIERLEQTLGELAEQTERQEQTEQIASALDEMRELMKDSSPFSSEPETDQ